MRRFLFIFMKLYVLIVIFLWGSGLCLSAQQRDSTYIQPYPQKVWVKLYIPTKFLSLSQGNNTYIPNYPFNLGVGIGLRKVLGFNLLYAHSLFYYQNKANMSTRSIDFQAHKYGKRILIDAYYQDYTGFYINKRNGNYDLYPTLSTQQVGVESTYIWRADKFSARAAFEQSELQVKSAGSLLFGSGLYWHRIVPDAKQQGISIEPFENFQIGVHSGYAYSWVLNQYWLLTGTFIMGINFGNQTKALREIKIKAYPTTTYCLSVVYHRNNWAISLSGISNNNIVYPVKDKLIKLTAPHTQFSLTKHLNFKNERLISRFPALKVAPFPKQNG